MSLEYRIGDVFDRLAEIPDGTIDLIVTSPPFLALRSYLPADHPDKHREIGSEATPADFLDTLLALSAEWGRVLAPHGSLCVELGDTYAGSGGAGGDYNPGGLREGQDKFEGSAYTARQDTKFAKVKRDDHVGGITNLHGKKQGGGNGWPLPKSLTGIPTLYPWSLAYGRNLLTGQPSPAGQWRIRNLIVWARPNPPVGALGDKFRPATSYITVACRSAKRYFDLDAVRVPWADPSDVERSTGLYHGPEAARGRTVNYDETARVRRDTNGGAPPLDWHADHHPEDGDWLWKLSTQPYAGAHYATFPMALPKRLIEAMCPRFVCLVCGRPSERIVESERIIAYPATASNGARINGGAFGQEGHTAINTLGWSDCGCRPPCETCGGRGYGVDSGGMGGREHCLDCKTTGEADHWRTGIVLDPFAGSGTTLEAAQAVGRHAIGIDLDVRNADLARDRVGMFLTVDDGDAA